MIEKETGFVLCIRLPMGDAGLEGYELGSVYEYDKRTFKDGTAIYKVCPDPKEPNYKEVVSTGVFKRYFEILK